MSLKQVLNTKVLIFSILCLSFQGCKDKQSNTQEVEEKTVNQTKTTELSTETIRPNILCFGNSLTAGYGIDDESKIWPTLLQKRLDSLSLNYNVINAGLSGETTAEGAQRISWVLKQPVDVFVLELGANDMLRGLAVENTYENLEEIIKKVKAKNPEIEIIISGMLAPPNMGKEYENAFNNTFTSLANKYESGLIPFFLQDVALIPDLNLPDGKHPNVAGQKIVLENVWKALSQVVKGN